MSSSLKPVFRFGPFELRSEPPALFRDGHTVSVTPKGLAMLAALVSKRGAAVSKEELLSTVWPDTVVEEASLSQNVYMLRKLLAQDFPSQNPIENIPRFGYRFTLPVLEEVTPALNSSAHLHPDADNGSAPRPKLTFTPKEASQRDEGTTTNTRTTFLWLLGTIPIVVGLMSGVWFYRHWFERPANTLQTMPYVATQFTSNSDEDRVNAMGLSPNGTLVAYADADGVVLRAMEDTSIHFLSSPHLSVVNLISWFPDQLHLVVSGEDAATGKAQVWKISVLGEPPVLLRDEARLGVPSHDGSSVAFTAASDSELWVIGPSGENSRKVMSVGAGNRISVLLWALHDDGLLMEQLPDVPVPISLLPNRQGPTQRFSRTYERIDLATGNPTSMQTNLSIGDACLTSNGDLIYSLTTSAESRDAYSLWKAPLESSGAISATAKQVFDASGSYALSSFSCDADGKRIAALRKHGSINVYVGTLGGGNTQLTDVRRLSFDSNQAYPHGWSVDGRSVLYESTRGDSGSTRRWQVNSQAMDRHDPEPLVSMSGSQSRPELTPDHRWLLFANVAYPHARKEVFRIPTQGGTPAMVPSQEELDQFRCPLLAGTCVVRTIEAGQTLYSILDPASGKGKSLFTEPSNWKQTGDWDISPDGSTLIVSSLSLPAMPLSTVSFATGAIHDIAYHPSQRTAAVNWASDGKGFFVCTKSPSGSNLYYVDLAGHPTLLRTANMATWAVPSPNGRSLAFADSSLDSNVWLLQAK